MLKIYNTISQKKEIFKPKLKNKVNMYVCGVTTYDLCHIGHARTFIVFDMISRYLRYIGYNLTYIRNITDIDDKIIKKSNKNNETCEHLSERMIIEMNKDFKSMNILKPDIEPKVTSHIKDIIKLIKKLINSGNAYISNNGDVMFNIKKNKNYGKLSKQQLKELKNKKNKLDFVLWKISKPNEPYWKSPWGKGRPGWHTECSAINKKYFDNHCDIHGGGKDLIFPHHENEMAQFNCINKKKYVNFWIHTGIVLKNKKKISKSTNNFFTIRNLLKRFDCEIIRYFLLSAHYRSDVNFTQENIKNSYISLKKLYKSIQHINNYKSKKHNSTKYTKYFIDSINDDFNTPKAYSILFKLSKKINKLKKNNNNIEIINNLSIELKKLANILGLLTKNPKNFLKNTKHINSNTQKIIEKLIHKRNVARNQKKWKEADSIRNSLLKMNITIEDNKNKTEWYFNKN